MRFMLSIKAKISLLVLLLGLLLIAGNQSRNEKLLVERSMARIEREAGATGTRLAGMMQHLFRKEQQQAAELEMSYASISTDVELGLVCDREDVVRVATRIQWRGVKLGETPLGTTSQMVKTARRSMDGVLKWDDAHERLAAVFPFFASYDSENRGIVVLSYDSRYAMARAKRDAMHESLAQACLLAGACLLLWLALDWLVARRVELVLDYTRAVREGDAPPPPLQGGDELAVIAQSFANTVDKVHKTELLLVEASETERRRIGRDIHDDVCQRITATQLKSGVLGTILAGGDPEPAALAEEITAELRETAAVARMFARGLAPVWVKKEGLAAALYDWAEQMERMFPVKCRIECDLGERPLQLWVQAHVFRIVQELTTNAAKHSQPNRVLVRLKITGEMLRVEVENDGLSFTPADIKGSGLGMQYVQQRVRAIGGKFSICSHDGGKGGALALCETRLSSIHFIEPDDTVP